MSNWVDIGMGKLAKLRRRAAASLIDNLLLMSVFALALIPYASQMLFWHPMTLGAITFAMSAGLYNLWVFYFTYFEWSKSQTPGKSTRNGTVDAA